MRMLKASGVEKSVLDAVAHFRCHTCEECKKDDHPRIVKPTRPDAKMKFNHEISVDVFEIHDAKEQRRSILSVLCLAARYHVAIRVGAGGTPSSSSCAHALNLAWFTPFGAPKVFTSDQGVRNKGRVNSLLMAHDVEIRRAGARAPFQLGTGERRGGLLKQVMKRAIQDRQLYGAEVISALCAESARAKNAMMNVQGYTPSQWVLGHTPDDVTAVIQDNFDAHLGARRQLLDMEEKPPQEMFMMQLFIR